jgi:hypothetical protein
MMENDYHFGDKYVVDYLNEFPVSVRHMIPLWCDVYGALRFYSIECEDSLRTTVKIIKCKTDDDRIVKFNYRGIAMVEIRGKNYELSEDVCGDVSLYPSKEKLSWSEVYKPQDRAKKGNRYFYINDCGLVRQEEEQLTPTDSCRWLFGNYFMTEGEAEKSNIYFAYHPKQK